ncbi:hypothetical protein [Stenotrophomonas maltophilia]|uniref:hypothetical protein n=1 Tax=Stenotrophomonas maltophilia TaxID=40324 RepID=UPI001FA7F4AF|nr:hypothetical protein [Stenotrophomonas maltophilia]
MKTIEYSISEADAVRHLIVCDTQFTWAGVTNLTLPQMMDLQARGWVVEGDDNDEFQLTEAGEAVVARALQHGVPKTLADVQPGGRVRLGDALLPCPLCGNDAEFVPYKNNGLTLKCKSMGCIQRHQCTLRYGIEWLRTSMTEHWNTRALSSQPSPGGQGDALHDAVSRIFGCDGSPWRTRDVAAVLRDYAALAARQPVGEPVAVVVPGAPTRCRHCESTDLEWFAHVRAVNDVPHGRLTTHDVACVFVLGCNECSETLHTVKADSIASLLAAPPVQAVNLGLQLDRYDAGLLGDGGGGDVNWWQDYLRAELDRAHEFYQDQADAHG